MSSSVWNIELKGGVKIPILGLGTYKAQGDDVKQITEEAIDVGYRHFDTAYFYQNLVPLGEAINKAIRDGKVKREDLFITTKVWLTWYGPGRVLKNIKNMLSESGLGYFDLVLLHWPTSLEDSDTEMVPKHPGTDNAIFGTRDIVDVYLELEDAQRQGLARAVGVSNFNIEQIERLLKRVKIIPATNQTECHLYLAEFELQKFCAQHGILLTAYCPLGNRPKTGKPSLLDDETVKNIANKYGKSPAQLAIRWLLQRGIIAIPKTVNPVRLRENFNVFDFELSDEDTKTLDKLDRGEQGRLVEFNYYEMPKHPEYPFKK